MVLYFNGILVLVCSDSGFHVVIPVKPEEDFELWLVAMENLQEAAQPHSRIVHSLEDP